MPRADSIPASMTLLKALILGDPKSGKTDWAMRAAEAGFNVLYLDGDVATQTIAQLSPEGKSRLYLMDIASKLSGDHHMIDVVADLMTSTRFLWNDSKQAKYSPTKDEHNEDGFATDEIWELRPSRFDHNWVWVFDSWTTLSYSALQAKAGDLGVELADIEKVEQNIYSGTGNRLNAILESFSRVPFHLVVIGHPSQFEKSRSPEGQRAGDVKAKDRIIEWTRMVPASSSNPHGLKMGKHFTDIGWMDIGRTGKRELNFRLTNTRVSGGHLDSKGDPRETHSFAKLVEAIGGFIPDGSQGLGEGLIIHPAGTFKPAVKNQVALGSRSQPLKASTQTKALGLAGIGGLSRTQA